MYATKIVHKIAEEVGIKINGNQATDIIVSNDQFYTEVARKGSLGLGESYMAGMWDCHALDQFFCKITNPKLGEQFFHNPILNCFNIFLDKMLNRQNVHRSKEVAKVHYDLGNELYKAMLDSELNYSCGYWRNASILEQAQYAKLDLICQKLGLQPGDKVLDIGCGWGSFARHAAKYYGVKVVGITISQEQATLANKLCQGLDIEIRLQDYRGLFSNKEGQFEHIVSIGMFEHVGSHNYLTFFQKISELLMDNGSFLLQTIGCRKATARVDPWLDKYIFPNGNLPSAQLITRSSEKYLCLEDWHNFGADYDKTLMSWYTNFNSNWNHLKDNYNHSFYRMWSYYLLSCAGAFRSRSIHLWQIVFSRFGLSGGYKSLR